MTRWELSKARLKASSPVFIALDIELQPAELLGQVFVLFQQGFERIGHLIEK
jgi:hypothetical protein